MSDTAQALRYTAFDVDGEGGNPAGVVLDARGLDAARMQEIAAGIGFSETAFLVDDEGSRPGGSASATSARWPRSPSAGTPRSRRPSRWPSAGGRGPCG